MPLIKSSRFAGTIVTAQNQLNLPLQMSIAGVQASVPYDGLTPSLTGLYQFNVVVPKVARQCGEVWPSSWGEPKGRRLLLIAYTKTRRPDHLLSCAPEVTEQRWRWTTSKNCGALRLPRRHGWSLSSPPWLAHRPALAQASYGRYTINRASGDRHPIAGRRGLRHHTIDGERTTPSAKV